MTYHDTLVDMAFDEAEVELGCEAHESSRAFATLFCRNLRRLAVEIEA